MLRVKMTVKESSKVSVRGGSSKDGTSAVGCAKRMVLPASPVSCAAGSPRRPRRTCFMHTRPRDASILVAFEASRTWGLSLPIQLSLAQAFSGMQGFLAAMS